MITLPTECLFSQWHNTHCMTHTHAHAPTATATQWMSLWERCSYMFWAMHLAYVKWTSHRFICTIPEWPMLQFNKRNTLSVCALYNILIAICNRFMHFTYAYLCHNHQKTHPTPTSGHCSISLCNSHLFIVPSQSHNAPFYFYGNAFSARLRSNGQVKSKLLVFKAISIH